MSDWKFLNANRVRSGEFASEDSDGFNGAFQITVNGLPIGIIASDGEGWRHVSVSIIGSKLPPSWSVMCQVKDLFWGPEDWVVQFHPAQSEYVNNHPGVLHLWQPINQPLPKPPAIMVGVKKEGVITSEAEAARVMDQVRRERGELH